MYVRSFSSIGLMVMQQLPCVFYKHFCALWLAYWSLFCLWVLCDAALERFWNSKWVHPIATEIADEMFWQYTSICKWCCTILMHNTSLHQVSSKMKSIKNSLWVVYVISFVFTLSHDTTRFMFEAQVEAILWTSSMCGVLWYGDKDRNFFTMLLHNVHLNR